MARPDVKGEMLQELIDAELVPKDILKAKDKLRKPVVEALYALAFGERGVSNNAAARLVTQANKLQKVQSELRDIARDT